MKRHVNKERIFHFTTPEYGGWLIPAMVRLIAHLLIVSLLTLNIAWAADECAFNDPGQVRGVLLQVDAPSLDFLKVGLDCDDWCQAWVSPVALNRSVVTHLYIPATISGGSYTFSYSSLSIPPPSHPPIA